MDIHHLKVFLAVYQSRSFSKASRQLFLSQPTVSEHIKNLEHELGCTLFDRIGKTILPTLEAEAIYPRTVHILEEAERIRDDLQPYETTVKGSLVIGASSIPGTYLLPPLVADFKRLHHDVSFQIAIGDSRKITDLVSGHELLLGAVGAVMNPEAIEYVPFMEDELILTAKKDIVRSAVISPRELMDIPLVIREEGSGTRNTVEKYLEKKNIDAHRLTIVGMLGSADSVKQAVKAGLGATIMSRIAVIDELESGVLREITIRGMSMTRKFYLIFHRKRTLPNPYRAFLDYLQQGRDTKKRAAEPVRPGQ